MSKLITPKHKIMVISDTQAPAHHPNTIEFLKHEAALFKPDKIIHIGDELDLHNFSKYAHDPDLPGPKDELEQGIAFMEELYDLFPEARVCISNHGARPYLRAKEAGLPTNFMRSYPEFMRAPKGWTWHHQILIDNIAFIHGEGLSGDGARLKACTLMQRSCVFGHLHSHAGLSYFSNKEQLLFGMNVGCLIDLHSPYFEYGRHSFYRPIVGIGLIDHGLPTFKPMQLDKYGLWVGRKDQKQKRAISQRKNDVRCTHCDSRQIRPYGSSVNYAKKNSKTGKFRNDYGKQYHKHRFMCRDCGRISSH